MKYKVTIKEQTFDIEADSAEQAENMGHVRVKIETVPMSEFPDVTALWAEAIRDIPGFSFSSPEHVLRIYPRMRKVFNRLERRSRPVEGKILEAVLRLFWNAPIGDTYELFGV